MKLNLKYNNTPYQLQVDRTKPVSQLRKAISDLLDLDQKRIILFYHGKILENSNTLYDYNVKDNAAILLHYKAEKVEELKVKTEESNITPVSETNESAKDSEATVESETKALAELGIDIDAIPQEDCNRCDNKETSDCSYCGCSVCHKKSDPEKQLICEECQMYFHTFCLPTPLEEIPKEDWYCHDCYNDPNLIISAGKTVKKRETTSKRAWDNGMACAGVEKKCTIVPSTHIGKIPGVPVGSWWEYRVKVAEAGIHRPPVSGIAGTSKNGSVSIVLAGGYEDDDDFGEEFYYTGSGGRDLSGNKRVAQQSSDQQLTKSNLALALNCDAPLDVKNGATARDWKKSKPVRVVRNYKLNKHHPKYAPETGNRYDGLYKIVKYWKEKGKSGFYVWRYHYRRDDDEPAPWTEEGKKRIKELGLEPTPSEKAATVKPKTTKRGKGRKKDDDTEDDTDSDSEEAKPKTRKKLPRNAKTQTITSFMTPKSSDSQDVKYEVPQEARDLISQDSENSRIWDEIVSSPGKNITEFLEKVAREFNCPICFDLVDNPITTNCTHNACSSCLKNSIRCYGNKCPLCRATLFDEVSDLSETKQINALIKIIEQHAVNAKLDKALTHLFPTMRQK